MKQIVKPRDEIAAVLGKKAYQADEKYRLLDFVLQQQVDEGRLLYNTLTGELLLVERGEDATSQLVEKFFLVPESIDADRTMLQLRQLIKLFKQKRGFDFFTILPTTACNARCFYCYEEGVKTCTMTKEMGEQVATFILNSCDRKAFEPASGRRVRLHWFGGEPLMGAGIISGICRRLEEKGLQFYSEITTNGYLFNDELVGEAKNLWKLKSAQITLDGTEDIYNKTKAYVGWKEGGVTRPACSKQNAGGECEIEGEGCESCEVEGGGREGGIAASPYKRVLANIERLLKAGISVKLRMNLGEHNAEDLERLIYELSEHFGQPANLYLYVHELFDNKDFSSSSEDEIEEELDSPEGLALQESRHRLNKLIKDLGFSQRGVNKLPALKLNRCLADSDDNIVITPAGKLTKCEHFLEEKLVGDIEKGICDRAELAAWKKEYRSSLCQNCPLRPGCILLEGCPAQRICNEREKQVRIEELGSKIKAVYLKSCSK